MIRHPLTKQQFPMCMYVTINFEMKKNEIKLHNVVFQSFLYLEDLVDYDGRMSLLKTFLIFNLLVSEYL